MISLPKLRGINNNFTTGGRNVANPLFNHLIILSTPISKTPGFISAGSDCTSEKGGLSLQSTDPKAEAKIAKSVFGVESF